MQRSIQYRVLFKNLPILCKLKHGLSYNAILDTVRTLQDHLIGLPPAEEYDILIKAIIVKWFDELEWANAEELDTALIQYDIQVENNPKEDLRVVLSDVITRRNLNLDNILD